MSKLDPQEGDVTSTVEVEIYGTVYNVRGSDPERLQELAAMVDEKMRKVATHARTVDTAKIAILTALNLAEELVKTRNGRVGGDDEIRQKVAGLAGELERALDSSAS
ncbi:MAG TPA: cell division protein ZapA [Thermoanaerobaculia bacterium]|nr:cell division protein ZapA [Thermoanaerobaculia bacterium]